MNKGALPVSGNESASFKQKLTKNQISNMNTD